MLSMHRKNIRALSLIVCTLTYLMIGAAVFDALESDSDIKKRELVDMINNKLMAKYNFSDKDFRVLQTIVVRSVPQKAGLQWEFAGAFYFATVVITLVGYGHSTPATRMGKIFCMLYALCGIPLNLVMFQSIGERLNTFISYALLKAKRCLKMKRQDVSPTHMIMVSGTLGTIVMLMGTYLFHKMEKWTLFESFYYCFITLTTIGFGDYVAIQRNETLRKRTDYIILSLLFILFGLAIFSAAVNLFVLRFMATNAESDANENAPHASILLRGVSDDDLADTPNGSVDTAQAVQSNRKHPGEQNHTKDNRTGVEVDEDTGLASTSDYHSCCTSCCPRHGPSWEGSVGSSKWNQDEDPFAPKPRMRYTVRRSPVPIGHLVSIHQFSQETAESNANGPRCDMDVSTV